MVGVLPAATWAFSFEQRDCSWRTGPSWTVIFGLRLSNASTTLRGRQLRLGAGDLVEGDRHRPGDGRHGVPGAVEAAVVPEPPPAQADTARPIAAIRAAPAARRRRVPVRG